MGYPPTKKTAIVVDGQHTDIVVNEFADRFFVVITQNGKVGTVVREILILIARICCDCFQYIALSLRLRLASTLYTTSRKSFLVQTGCL